MHFLQRTFDFIFQSRDILLKLINQLSTASKNLGSTKSPGMGLKGLKTLALAVTAAFAAKITYDQIQKITQKVHHHREEKLVALHLQWVVLNNNNL